MNNTGSLLFVVLISLCLSFAALFFIASGAAASGIPEVPPPTPVNPAEVNPSTTTYTPPAQAPVCVQYKAMTVTYVCGTEEKCYFQGKKRICVEVEKRCERLENICVKWQ
ncbi:MAG: hypothetical protein L3J03_10535 [Desulfobacterales bacterium]|nr:hypothetical protein [Desulfobacterales bacterium]